MDDLFNLARFLDAQAPVMDAVLHELAIGQKRSHWMWFVFPQISGLGHTAMAVTYAIASMEEAMAYLGHPVLGLRLRHCTMLVNQVEGRSIRAILGQPDDMKFRSCMTLFSMATQDNAIFRAALERYFDGKPDLATLSLLA